MYNLIKLLVSTLIVTSIFSCSNKVIDLNEYSQNIISTNSLKASTRDAYSIIKKFNEKYEKRNPELIKTKYKFMAETPFSFYRATSYLYYQDISKIAFLNSPIKVAVQGDFHLENIGTYKLSSGFSFDLNDFDDASVGSYTWDIARGAVSIALASENNNFDKDDKEKLVDKFLNKYLEYTNDLKTDTASISNPISKKYLSDKAQKLLNNVSSTSYKDFIGNFVSNGILLESDKVKKLAPQEYQKVSNALNTYFSSKRTGFKLKDVAYYISGKGSLGRYRYIALVQTGSGDLALMDIKEAVQAGTSVITGAINGNQAERVVNYTKYFQVKSDYFLGTINIDGLDFFIRQLNPDDRVNWTKLDKGEFKDFIDTVAYTLAKAHSKSNKNLNILADSDNVLKIKDFALSYTEQVKADFQQFRDVLASK